MQPVNSVIAGLVQKGRVLDAVILARFGYRIGIDTGVSDTVYKALEEYLKENNTGQEFLDRTYDDDPIPYDLLEETNLSELLDGLRLVGHSKYAEQLGEDKSLSIKPLEDYETAYEYFTEKREEGVSVFIFSGKANGWNTKSLYLAEEGEKKSLLRICLSRARSAIDSMDFTIGARKVVPSVIDKVGKFTVFAEAIVDSDMYRKVPKIANDNGKPFTSPRMCAGSMLRVILPDKWYKYLHLYAFNADGLASTIHETLEILRDMGFDTVPYFLVDMEEVPVAYDEFCDWLKIKMDKVWDMCREKKIMTDGLVVDVDDKNYVGTVNGSYSNRNVALKFEQWSYNYYTGTVRDIHIEQQEVQASFVLEIDPILTSDNVEATRITGYNLDILISQGITIGSQVHFVRNSEAINVLISDAEVERLEKRKTHHNGGEIHELHQFG